MTNINEYLKSSLSTFCHQLRDVRSELALKEGNRHEVARVLDLRQRKVELQAAIATLRAMDAAS